MQKETITEFKKIGRVLKTHGLEGSLVVEIEDAFSDVFLSAEFIFLDLNGSIVPFCLEGIQQVDPLIIFLEDVTSPDSAARIAPSDILLPALDVPAAQSPGVKADFAWAEGYTVFTAEQGQVGQIIRVETFPQQSMAFIAHQGREIMFPLHEDLIRDIDNAARTIILDIPEGLLDLLS